MIHNHMAHFFVIKGGSKIRDQVVHFFIDIHTRISCAARGRAPVAAACVLRFLDRPSLVLEPLRRTIGDGAFRAVRFRVAVRAVVSDLDARRDKLCDQRRSPS